MITPKFECTQTEKSVIVRIYAPAVRASDVEIHVDDTLFSLHINPYFLRLNFPGAIIEDEASSAEYDPGSGYLTVTLTKANPGQHFSDLDLLAKLLAPKRPEPVHQQPVIEVLSSSEDQTARDGSSEDDITRATEQLSLEEPEVVEAIKNDWQFPQRLPEEPLVTDLSTQRCYGFMNMYTGYFKHVEHTENEVNELGSEAETMRESERRERRIKHENEKWDEEYYMADFADDEYIQEIINYQFQSDSPFPRVDTKENVTFTEDENLAMLRLPQKEYLVTEQQRHNLYLTLVTFLFSVAYDSRTTQEDPTPESAWTICSLTPAFSALDPPPYVQPPSPLSWTPEELHDTLIPSIRRSLSFPLYRSYALSSKCVEDVAFALLRGKKSISRALLSMKKILDHHEVYYIYSKIWVDDFCVWVARDASDEELATIGKLLQSITIDKSRLGWDLSELEDAVRRQISRVPDSDDESVASGEAAQNDTPPSSSSSSEVTTDSEDD